MRCNIHTNRELFGRYDDAPHAKGESELRWCNTYQDLVSRQAAFHCVIKVNRVVQEQTGAVEACWAHNPEVRGSKPRSANIFLLPAIEIGQKRINKNIKN